MFNAINLLATRKQNLAVINQKAAKEGCRAAGTRDWLIACPGKLSLNMSLAAEQLLPTEILVNCFNYLTIFTTCSSDKPSLSLPAILSRRQVNENQQLFTPAQDLRAIIDEQQEGKGSGVQCNKTPSPVEWPPRTRPQRLLGLTGFSAPDID
ncbi:uncharacterized protein DMAD_03504 [Drosophila madeirensis]|uniref:Uncharacterized protein n=1 Tax=Drosophila madeirensis TaxID=30013 RepID=A0AAU9G9F4_DROMD